MKREPWERMLATAERWLVEWPDLDPLLKTVYTRAWHVRLVAGLRRIVNEA